MQRRVLRRPLSALYDEYAVSAFRQSTPELSAKGKAPNSKEPKALSELKDPRAFERD